jgi:dTDP-4-amino-4,6-dideoxygalactose transaminase
MKVRYTHDILGWNSRMDSLQAVVLNIKLKHLDAWVRRRRELAMRYNEAFDGLEKQCKITLPREMPGCDHVWNQYTVLVDHRDDVRAKLAELKIPTEVYYPKTLPVQPALKFLGVDENLFPISVNLAKRAMSLPVFPELTDSEHLQVIDAVKKVLS